MPWFKDRHRSREFIEFLKLLDAAYPASTAIKLILDNHSAHISRETKAWLAEQPAHRFDFTFTPKHGSWLTLVEGFFSKLARSVLRHIRADKAFDTNAIRAELDERGALAVIPSKANRKPVIPHDAEMYKWRHLIENCFQRLKEFRRIATHYDKTDTSFAAALHLVATVIHCGECLQALVRYDFFERQINLNVSGRTYINSAFINLFVECRKTDRQIK
jgi:transposase